MLEVLVAIALLSLILVPLLFLASCAAGVICQNLENEVWSRRHAHLVRKEARQCRKRELERWYSNLR